MPRTPFFHKDKDRFIPTEASKGPWGENSLHGRVMIGLLGAEIERRHATPDYLPTRLTVDMYRLPDLSPVEVTTRVIRDGHRIKVIDAEYIYGRGISGGRATCVLLRKTENPPGEIWKPAPWRVPSPGELPPPSDPRAGMNGMWDMRPISGGALGEGPRRVWMREIRELVAGEPWNPFGRVATAADFVSPAVHFSDKGLRYINTDVTVYLHREPVSEWIGFDPISHGATAGVAVGDCFIYDEYGPIGTGTCMALAQPNGSKRMQQQRQEGAQPTP